MHYSLLATKETFDNRNNKLSAIPYMFKISKSSLQSRKDLINCPFFLFNTRLHELPCILEYVY